MIEKLEIRNFSTHKKLDVEFGPGVTTIIGSSYAGKSALIRALRWITTNKPSGDQFINWDANKTSVRLSFDDKKITRKKGAGTNLYKLGKKEYTAFGNNVPSSISKALNISDINFRGQHDGPFWFCQTAGEVSRQLNAIVNLEVIDITLSNIASVIRKAKTTVEITQEKLAKVVQRKKELAYIKDMDRDLAGVEGLQKQHQKNVVRLDTIREFLKIGVNYASDRENAEELVRDSGVVLSAGQKCQNIAVRVENLSKLVEVGSRLQKVIDARPPSLSHLKKLKATGEGITNKRDCLYNLMKVIQTNREKKCQTETEATALRKELQKLAGGRCPLCGASMKK